MKPSSLNFNDFFRFGAPVLLCAAFGYAFDLKDVSILKGDSCLAILGVILGFGISIYISINEFLVTIHESLRNKLQQLSANDRQFEQEQKKTERMQEHLKNASAQFNDDIKLIGFAFFAVLVNTVAFDIDCIICIQIMPQFHDIQMIINAIACIWALICVVDLIKSLGTISSIMSTLLSTKTSETPKT